MDEVGVKLLLLSLRAHEPNAEIFVSTAALSDNLNSWVKDNINAVQIDISLDRGLGWNVKPSLLLSLLDAGVESVTWLDSDVILTQPIAKFFSRHSSDTIVVAEEYFTFRNRGVAERARGWGLDAGRELPYTPNTCVLRVTQHHRELLMAWQKLLSRPDYVNVQNKPWRDRPFYMMGDQDALAALLGSVEFKEIRVRRLRRGRDIAQCFQEDGYGPFERVRNVFNGLPPFVHAQGEKPWRPSAGENAYQEVSAYRYAALAFDEYLSKDERAWLRRQSRTAAVMDRIMLGHPSLAGLGFAVSRRLEKRLSGLVRLLSGVGR